MLSDIYTDKLLAAASSLPPGRRLDGPGVYTARRTSRVCGSEMEIDVWLEAGVVRDVAVRARACALGQAAAGLFVPLLIGARPDEIRRAHDDVLAMLKSGAPLPRDPRWAALAPLSAIRDYPQRHASTMLVFEAAVDCVDQAENLSGS